QLLEDAGGDLLRRVGLAVDRLGLPVGAHVALDGGDGAVDVRHRLALRGLADEHLAVFREGHDGRSRAKALGVRDDLGLTAFEHGDDGVRRSEVDSNSSCHVFLLSFMAGPSKRADPAWFCVEVLWGRMPDPASYRI